MSVIITAAPSDFQAARSQALVASVSPLSVGSEWRLDNQCWLIIREGEASMEAPISLREPPITTFLTQENVKKF